MIQSTPVADRRRFGRKPCRVKARIKAPRLEPVACLVLDYSDGGARIELEAIAKLPAQFDLCLEDINLVVPCNLRHMFGRNVGIEFIEQPGRRSLNSAFGTEKLLAWLAQDPCRVPVASPALNASHGIANAEPTTRAIGQHPLRSSLYTKVIASEPAITDVPLDPPTQQLPAADTPDPAPGT